MQAGIALGSNLGDRLANLRAAAEACAALGAGDARRSHVYETAPFECEDATPPFLNAFIEIEPSCAPVDLLDALREIELRFGRPQTRPKNAPREIDLDIIYFGSMHLRLDGLEVPHPRASRRDFVLRPMNDVCPARILPGETRTVAELLAKVESLGGECGYAFGGL